MFEPAREHPGGPRTDPEPVTRRLHPPDDDVTRLSFGEAAGTIPSTADEGRPDSIGRYEVVDELGRGGMGVVYLARDPEQDRRVAIKVLPAGLAADPQLRAHFQREARLLAALNHPGIASIYTLEEDGEVRFLTMEAVLGSSLAQRIPDRSVALRDWLAICREIAVALEAAHRLGVVHLDLKPQNVMLTAEGTVKVLDFGLAMAIGREPEAASDARSEVKTRAGAQAVISGTPGYMSPEQLRGEMVDSRADLWAFGCLLHECLSGEPAFPGDGPWDRARRTLEGAAQLDSLPSEASDRLRELIAQCLEPDPARRLDSITRARRTLELEIVLSGTRDAGPRAELGPNNLPLSPTGFIGRERQKEGVRRLLAEQRLVTLIGTGGGGKTRLAVEVGREICSVARHGVWFVELAPVLARELVPGAVVAALGLRESAKGTPVDLLLRHFAGQEALLLLDGCENLREAVAALATELLDFCPNLRILATSREALGCRGEQLFHVPSMAVPSAETGIAPGDLATLESVQLFLARARAVHPEFELEDGNAASIAQICRRLDGIPLAIELAAARAAAHTPAEIAQGLDDRFRTLDATAAATPGQGTLRELIDWSYDHLSEPEQALLRRLSLFAGGWTLDAAEAICTGEGIESWELLGLLLSLVGKSMAETDAAGTRESGLPRYRMLETIREYGRSRLLERREGSEVLERHRAYYLSLAEEAAPKLTGAEQAAYLRRLSREEDNLYLALDLCGVPGADPELGWRFAGALGRFWYLRGQWSEGRRMLAELFDRPDAPRDSAAAAEALNWAGNLAKLQGDYPQARSHLEECLSLRRRLGQDAGIASALNNLANVLKDVGSLESARALYEESLRLQRRLENVPGIALALSSLGVLTYLQRDYDASLAFHEESLVLRRRTGDRSAVAATLNNLAAAAESMGDSTRATSCLVESLALQRELGDRWGVAASLTNLGRLAVARGDTTESRVFYEEGLAIFREMGDRRGAALCLHSLGLICQREGVFDSGRAHLRECLVILGEIEARPSFGGALFALGILEAEAGSAPRAGMLLGAAESLRLETGDILSPEDEESRRRAHRRLEAAPDAAGFRESLDAGRQLDWTAMRRFVSGETV